MNLLRWRVVLFLVKLSTMITRFCFLFIALMGCLQALAQYDYEPSPKGTIPSDTLVYNTLPDSLHLCTKCARSGEPINPPARWTLSRQFPQSAPSEDPWWRSFDDPILNALINRAESASFSLGAALRRMQVAQRQEQIARAAYLPTVSASAGYTLAKSSGAMGKTVANIPHNNYWQLGLSAAWEVDLFGRVQAQIADAKAAQQLAKADYDAGLVSLCAQVAKAYVQLRLYQAEYMVAAEHIRSQEKIVEMTEARHEAGLAAKLDVVQAQVVLTSTQATMPPLEAMIRAQINSIATLCGTYTDSIAPLLEEPAPMPNCYQNPAVGKPMDLLRRRPDIAEAEATLAADAAAIGIAKKDFLPTLSLEAEIGTAAHAAKNLFKHASLTYSVAPTLSWTIFDGMARNYRLAAAREQMLADIDTYNLTLLQAVQEVDAAGANYDGYIHSLSYLNKLVKESREALDLSVSLYRSTIASFTNVVDAQMNLLEYENTRLQTQANALLSLITLYEALGGGY